MEKDKATMQTIHVDKTASVPVGVYCCDYGCDPKIKECQCLRSSQSKTTWRDGLGPPGVINSYHCALFDSPLGNCYPHEGFYGLTVKKCRECLDCNQGSTSFAKEGGCK